MSHIKFFMFFSGIEPLYSSNRGEIETEVKFKQKINLETNVLSCCLLNHTECS